METSAVNSAADRNLLFGILAIQMDFVSREQLIAATSTWVLEKQTPLDEILTRQGSLKPDHRTLLTALVAAHLKQHGDDFQRSLAAVSSIGSVRDQLHQLADSEIDATLAHVSQDCPPADYRSNANSKSGTDPLATRSMGESTSDGVRFRILRPHAKGGLGEVFVAADAELGREVALKQIQPHRADDPNSRARFVLEAEITGGLEHPGIVPVYGLGNYANGRPFYAMRFIRGDSLKDALQRFHDRGLAPFAQSSEQKVPVPLSRRSVSANAYASVAFRKLLGRFIDVCNAIEYAHSRGVLHRDLKPGNIMLGNYGETLVVDWGLAKALGRSTSVDAEEAPVKPSSGSGSAPTQMGSAIGTPQFMSPEQAAGRLDLLGPASDVYSLGATLYCLLTGAMPFADIKETDEIIRRVKSGEFDPPGALNPHIPKSLELICLKAMARRPDDRYASPRLLADDIEHWLADEPLAASPDSWTERVARWTGRHRAWAQAAAAALFFVAIVASGAVLLINQQKDVAIALANDKSALATREKDARERAERLASENATIAEKERLARESALQLARDKATLAQKEFDARQKTVLALEEKNTQAERADKAAQNAIDEKEKALAAARRADQQSGIAAHQTHIATENAEKLARQLRVVTAWRMHSDALRLAEQSPQKAILLARKAMDSFREHGEPIPLGMEDGLRTALSHAPGITIPAVPPYSLYPVEFSPGGRWLIVPTSPGVDGNPSKTELWDLVAGARNAKLALTIQRRFASLMVSPDDRWLVAGGSSDRPTSGQPAATRPPPPPPPFPKSTSSKRVPPVNQLATGGSAMSVSDDQSIVSGTTVLWDLSAAESLAKPRVVTAAEGASCFAFSMNGKWLAIGTSSGGESPVPAPPRFGVPAPPKFPGATAPTGGAIPPPPPAVIPKQSSTPTPNPPFPIKSARSTSPIRFVAVDNSGNSSARGSQTVAALALWDLNQDDPLTTRIVLLDQAGPIVRLSFSPDGRWLIADEADRTLHVFDLRQIAETTTAERLTIRHEVRISSIHISHDSRKVAVGFLDGSVSVWDLLNPHLTVKPQTTLRTGDAAPAMLLGFAANSRWLVGYQRVNNDKQTQSSELRIWDLNSPKSKFKSTGAGMGGFLDIPTTMSLDGRWLVAGKLLSPLSVWDLSGENPSPRTGAHPGALGLLHLVFSGDGNWLLGSADGTVYKWDMRNTESSPTKISGFGAGSVPIATNRDASAIAVNRMEWQRMPPNPNGKVAGWGSPAGEFMSTGFLSICDFNGMPTAIEPFTVSTTRTASDLASIFGGYCFSSDARWLAIADKGTSARVFDLRSSKVWAVSGLKSQPRSLEIGENEVLTAVCNDGSVYFWRLAMNRGPDLIKTGSGALSEEGDSEEIATSPDGRWMAATFQVGGFDSIDLDDPNSHLNTLGLWSTDPSDKYPWPRLRITHQGLHGSAFSPDGRWLATSGDDGIRLWDMHRKKPEQVSELCPMSRGNLTELGKATAPALGSIPISFGFSANGRWLIAGNQNEVRAWDLKNSDSPRFSRVLKAAGRQTWRVDLSKGGNWLMILGDGLQLFDLRRPEPLENPKIIQNGTVAINGFKDASLSEDGTRLSMVSDDNETRVFDLRRPEPFATPRSITWQGNGTQIVQEFLADGRLAAFRLDDRTGIATLTALTVDDDELLRIAKRVAGRELSPDDLLPYNPDSLEKTSHEATTPPIPRSEAIDGTFPVPPPPARKSLAPAPPLPPSAKR